MGIVIRRIPGTQQYEPAAICDLCGEPITNGSGHVKLKPDGRVGQFDVIVFHRYSGGNGGYRTCRYLNQNYENNRPSGESISGMEGWPLVEFLDRLMQKIGS